MTVDEEQCHANNPTDNSKAKKKAIRWGIIATVLLAAIYVVLLWALSGHIEEVGRQLQRNGVLLALLMSGFGTQIGMWRYLKSLHESTANHAGGVTAAVGTTLTGSMIACCTHYLVNVLPWLGLTGLSGALMLYQTQILVGSIGINLLGIAYMIRLISRHRRHHMATA